MIPQPELREGMDGELARVQAFLFYEAALLDAWQLDEWLALFTEDARYVVPSVAHRRDDPAQTLVLIDDDRVRLAWRVNRLKSRHAHREYPWSRTRRLISNVRVTGHVGERVAVEAAFVVYRFRHDRMDPYVGQYDYQLVPAGASYRIAWRRATLDHEILSPNGTVSIIL